MPTPEQIRAIAEKAVSDWTSQWDKDLIEVIEAALSEAVEQALKPVEEERDRAIKLAAHRQSIIEGMDVLAGEIERKLTSERDDLAEQFEKVRKENRRISDSTTTILRRATSAEAENARLRAQLENDQNEYDAVYRKLAEERDVPEQKLAEARAWIGKHGHHPHDCDASRSFERECDCGLYAIRQEIKPPTSPAAPSKECGQSAGHLIAGYSYYACVLPKDHDGYCRSGGTCVKHGPYINATAGQPVCPEWPTCIPSEPAKEP